MIGFLLGVFVSATILLILFIIKFYKFNSLNNSSIDKFTGDPDKDIDRSSFFK